MPIPVRFETDLGEQGHRDVTTPVRLRKRLAKAASYSSRKSSGPTGPGAESVQRSAASSRRRPQPELFAASTRRKLALIRSIEKM